MKTVKDCTFRDLYHRVCYLEANENINKALPKFDFEGRDDATGVLVYGYIDYEAGFTFEVLCWASLNSKGRVKFNKGNAHVSMKLRRGSVENCPVIILNDPDVSVYQDKLAMVNAGYTCTDDVAETRNLLSIDPCRNEDFPDDVMVIIWKEDLQPEGCWVRCTGLKGNRILGKLLNEPNQDFGVHLGDIISFGVIKQESGPLCLAPL